jgi:uncharacterized delta-60 repeat protein
MGAAAGTLDPSFGTGGESVVDFGNSSDQLSSLALQGDRGIVLAGFSNLGGGLVFAAARLSATGALDNSFGAEGKTVVPFRHTSEALDVAVDSQSRPVLAGFTYNPGGDQDFAVTRLKNDGNVDGSFGINGKSIGDISSGSNDIAYAVALQPDDKILAAGSTDTAGQRRFATARLLDPSGNFDGAFGAGGRRVTSFGGLEGATDMQLQPDGSIVLAGTTDVNGSRDFAVARLKTDGTLDSQFGDGGKSIGGFGPGSRDSGNAVALQPDGKILVAGSTDVNGDDDFAVERLSVPSGNFDPSFGDGGKAVVNFRVGQSEAANEMALQPDGKIVLVGVSNHSIAVARLLPDGKVDPSFGTNGRSIIDLPTDFEAATSVAIQPEGGIVVGAVALGTSSSAPADFTVIRLLGAAGGGGGSGGDPGGLNNGGGNPGGSGTPLVPVASQLKLAPASFTPAKSGLSIAAKKKPAGTKVTYRLTGAATMAFGVERAIAGRVSGGKCRQESKTNRTGKRCSIYKPVKGSFAHPGEAGSNSFRFTGRVGGKPLAPGGYRLVGAPAQGKPVHASFRILP